MFVMQPLLYVCYALDTYGAKSYVVSLKWFIGGALSFVPIYFPKYELINEWIFI